MNTEEIYRLRSLHALPDEACVAPGDAALVLGISGSTLELWRRLDRQAVETPPVLTRSLNAKAQSNRPPLPFVLIGQGVRYRMGALRSFISARDSAVVRTGRFVDWE